MNQRRATVHDLTALSLHPTGARAQPHHTNSLQDARGNWIATDAGGWGAVPLRRRAAADGIESGGEDEDEPAEEEDADADADADVEDVVKYSNRRSKTDGGRNAKDRRARKRRKLVHDVDFIYGQNPRTAPVEGDDDNALEFSTPSSVCLLSFFIIKRISLCAASSARTLEPCSIFICTFPPPLSLLTSMCIRTS
jgi:hypothetical protein